MNSAAGGYGPMDWSLAERGVVTVVCGVHATLGRWG